MTTYGENRIDIPFMGGEYTSPSTDAIPDGTNIACTNLMRTSRGTLAVRGSFKLVGGAVGWNTRPVVTTTNFKTNAPIIPDVSDMVRSFSFNNVQDQPTILTNSFQTLNKAGNIPPLCSVRMVNARNNSGTTTVKGEAESIGNAALYWAMCQYKDRIYAANSGIAITGVAIHQASAFTNFTAAIGSWTVTAITNPLPSITGSACEALVSFKDRIFAAVGSRIYFTEVATVGGYPDNWNSGNNFLDISLELGLAVIHNIHLMNDKMFIMTERGVYLLLCSGSSSSWSLQLITPDYSTFSRNSSCRVKNNIIFSDRINIYAFNGASFKKISGPIDHIFTRMNGCEVFPFEDGVLIQLSNASVVQTGANYVYSWPSGCTFYYFDGSAFVSLTLPASLTTYGVSGTFNAKQTSSDPLVPRTYLAGWEGCWYYDPFDFKGDHDISLTRQPYNFIFQTKFISKPFNTLKKYKNAYLDLRLDTMFTGTDILAQIKIPPNLGTAAGTAGTRYLTTTNVGTNTDIVAKIGNPNSQYSRRAGVYILGTMRINVANTAYAPFELKGICLKVESDMNDVIDGYMA